MDKISPEEKIIHNKESIHSLLQKDHIRRSELPCIFSVKLLILERDFITIKLRHRTERNSRNQ